MAVKYKRYNSEKLTPTDFAKIIPSQLYKYRAINDSFDKILKTNTLWFSKPSDFNDPFDCRLEVSMGKTKSQIMENVKQYAGLYKLKTKEQQAIMDQMLNNPIFYNEFMNKIHQIYINEKVGVCCMAEEPNNILMWSHYASSHTGVCLEFEIERNGFFFHNVLPVQYKAKYPRFDLSKFKNYRRTLYTMHQQAICTKSLLWEYENEWRVIVDTGPGAYEFQKKHLRKVIFGARALKEDIEKVKEKLIKYEYKNTLLYQAIPLAKSFGMKIIPI